MSNKPQKPGEKPNQSGPHIEVKPGGKPVSPAHTEATQPDAGHLPPTQKPGHEWKPVKKS